jgi:hypothetical protein
VSSVARFPTEDKIVESMKIIPEHHGDQDSAETRMGNSSGGGPDDGSSCCLIGKGNHMLTAKGVIGERPKVLHQKKAWMVANQLRHTLGHARFAEAIGEIVTKHLDVSMNSSQEMVVHAERLQTAAVDVTPADNSGASHQMSPSYEKKKQPMEMAYIAREHWSVADQASPGSSSSHTPASAALTDLFTDEENSARATLNDFHRRLNFQTSQETAQHWPTSRHFDTSWRETLVGRPQQQQQTAWSFPSMYIQPTFSTSAGVNLLSPIPTANISRKPRTGLEAVDQSTTLHFSPPLMSWKTAAPSSAHSSSKLFDKAPNCQVDKQPPRICSEQDSDNLARIVDALTEAEVSSRVVPLQSVPLNRRHPFPEAAAMGFFYKKPELQVTTSGMNMRNSSSRSNPTTADKETGSSDTTAEKDTRLLKVR